jgi:hypothetical protein
VKAAQPEAKDRAPKLVSIRLRERFGFDQSDGTQSEQQAGLKTVASPDVAAE